MSFQCSPASATPGPQRGKDGSKWRKSVGCSSESEPTSSLRNNVGSQSPDTSPVLGRGGKKVTCKLVSPKLRKKSFKTQADVPAASASVPPPSSEARVADGKEPRTHFQHCSPLSTASQASTLTELTQPAQNLPDPGRCHCSYITHHYTPYITFTVHS